MSNPASGQRRYYLVDYGAGIYRGWNSLEMVNRNEIEFDWPDNQGRHIVPGWDDAAPEITDRLGLIPYRDTPRVIVAPRSKTTLDAYGCYGNFLVSDRMKRLFEEIDGDAFEFEATETTHGKNNPPQLGPYWRAAVIRQIDCLDEKKSILRYHVHEDGNISRKISSIFEISMAETCVGDQHAFYLRTYSAYPIFDEFIVDACRKLGYKGLKFSSLQTPVGIEAKFPHLTYHRNYGYWQKKGINEGLY